MTDVELEAYIASLLLAADKDPFVRAYLAILIRGKQISDKNKDKQPDKFPISLVQD
jgi:hypothetical protein